MATSSGVTINVHNGQILNLNVYCDKETRNLLEVKQERLGDSLKLSCNCITPCEFLCEGDVMECRHKHMLKGSKLPVNGPTLQNLLILLKEKECITGPFQEEVSRKASENELNAKDLLVEELKKRGTSKTFYLLLELLAHERTGQKCFSKEKQDWDVKTFFKTVLDGASIKTEPSYSQTFFTRQSARKLEVLEVSKIHYPIINCFTLSYFRQLSSLYLHGGNEQQNVIVKHLFKLPQTLQKLYLINLCPDLASFQVLQNLEVLVIISPIEGIFDNIFLHKLKDCPSLQKWYLQPLKNNEIFNDYISKFQEDKNLPKNHSFYQGILTPSFGKIIERFETFNRYDLEPKEPPRKNSSSSVDIKYVYSLLGKRDLNVDLEFPFEIIEFLDTPKIRVHLMKVRYPELIRKLIFVHRVPTVEQVSELLTKFPSVIYLRFQDIQADEDWFNDLTKQQKGFTKIKHLEILHNKGRCWAPFYLKLMRNIKSLKVVHPVNCKFQLNFLKGLRKLRHLHLDVNFAISKTEQEFGLHLTSLFLKPGFLNTKGVNFDREAYFEIITENFDALEKLILFNYSIEKSFQKESYMNLKTLKLIQAESGPEQILEVLNKLLGLEILVYSPKFMPPNTINLAQFCTLPNILVLSLDNLELCVQKDDNLRFKTSLTTLKLFAQIKVHQDSLYNICQVFPDLKVLQILNSQIKKFSPNALVKFLDKPSSSLVFMEIRSKIAFQVFSSSRDEVLHEIDGIRMERKIKTDKWERVNLRSSGFEFEPEISTM